MRLVQAASRIVSWRLIHADQQIGHLRLPFLVTCAYHVSLVPPSHLRLLRVTCASDFFVTAARTISRLPTPGALLVHTYTSFLIAAAAQQTASRPGGAKQDQRLRTCEKGCLLTVLYSRNDEPRNHEAGSYARVCQGTRPKTSDHESRCCCTICRDCAFLAQVIEQPDKLVTKKNQAQLREYCLCSWKRSFAPRTPCGYHRSLHLACELLYCYLFSCFA